MPEAMRSQLLELAKTHAPFEMIGLLGGDDDNIKAFVPAKNHSPTPRVAFYVEPDAERTLATALFESGHDVIGAYHSHTVSHARPSQMDLKMVRPGWIMVIVSPQYEEVCAYEADGTPIDLELLVPVGSKARLTHIDDLPDTLDEDDVL